MVSAVYCPDCGAKSSSYSVKCAACGSNLPSPTRKNPLYQKVAPVKPKAAVFDLDGTIFDNFQRFKDARRAGLIDKDGKPVQKGRQSMGAAWKKRNKFLYTKKNLANDTLIPGVKETITSLTNDGYIIVYLTARPREYYTEILEQLESNGLPIFRDNTDSVLLITKPPGRMKASEYKGDEVRKLQGEFDVRMAFDDDLDALAEMSKYDVPGLYESISDHAKVNPKVRNNPSHKGCPLVTQDLEMNTRNRNSAIQADYIQYGPLNLDDEDYWKKAAKHWKTTVAVAKKSKCSNCVAFDISPRMLDCMPGSVQEDGQLGMCWMHNFKCHSARSCFTWAAGGPITDDKVSFEWQERSSFPMAEPIRVNGNHVGIAHKHRGETYVTGTDDIEVAYRVIPDPDDEDGRTVGETSGRTITADSIQTSLEDWVKRENPVKRGNDSKGGYYRWGKGKKYHYKTGSDRSRNIARKKAYEQAKAAYAGGYRKNPHKSDYRQAAGAIIMHKDQILLLRRSTKETSKHGMWELPGGKLEEGETPEQAAMIEAKEESGLDIEIKGKAGAHADHDKEKVYHAFLAEPKNVNQEVKLSEEHDESLWVSLDQALSMREDELSHHAKYFFEKMKKPTEVKTNPANPKKVEKGKKLYKHMNGQNPEKVAVEKIDIGDVWYKVGEGGCWQIGYMSGKETGQESQKYIHTFNEETKDGNFPELYATMPEKGKPMLIIKGGTWKIRTDDTGVAWIYD